MNKTHFNITEKALGSNEAGYQPYNRNLPNILTIQAIGGSQYKMDIELNAKECQLIHPIHLAFPIDVNANWDLACESIRARTGIEIQGNYQLISYRIQGIMRNIH